MQALFEKISEALIEGNGEQIEKLTQQALDGGAKAGEILGKGLIPGMEVIGKRFKVCEIFIPEVLLSAKTMHAAIKILKPLLSEKETIGSGTVLMGTVQGDLHDIGKNLVGMMLEGAGFRVVDLGVDVKPLAFVDAVKKHKADILGMSALLTTTMTKMEETIKALQEAGIRKQIKVMAGGAPITQDFVEMIGADAYGANASIAVEKAKELIAQK